MKAESGLTLSSNLILLGALFLFAWSGGWTADAQGGSERQSPKKGARKKAASAPATPGSLSATLFAPPQGWTSITLSWIDRSNNEDGFKIERATLEKPFAEVAQTKANVETFKDEGLTPNTEYGYRIRAFNASGNSEYSAITGSTTHPLPPDTPTHLSVTALAAPDGRSKLRLSWQSGSRENVSFAIERRTGDGGFEPRIETNRLEFTDTQLKPGTTYDYRIYASNQGGKSDPSQVSSGTTLPCDPGATVTSPDRLSAVGINNGQIQLTWRDRSNDETGFVIERRSPKGSFAVAQRVEENVTETRDGGLKPGSTWEYRVCAISACAVSEYSDSATGTTRILRPEAPTSLIATPRPGPRGQTAIKLTWVDNSNTESGFRIVRHLSGLDWPEIGRVRANVNQFTDTGLAANTDYRYRVWAFNSGGDSLEAPLAVARTRTERN